MSGFYPLLNDIFANATKQDATRPIDRALASIEPQLRAIALACVAISDVCKNPIPNGIGHYAKSLKHAPKLVTLEGVKPPHGAYTQWLTFKTESVCSYGLDATQFHNYIGTPICEVTVNRPNGQTGPGFVIGFDNGNITFTKLTGLLSAELPSKEIPLGDGNQLLQAVSQWMHGFFGDYTMAEAQKAAKRIHDITIMQNYQDQSAWGTPAVFERLTAC